MNEKVWNLKLTHSDLIEIYNTTTDSLIKRKIENHFLADRMKNWKNWSEVQWKAVRKFYNAHGKYPEDSWWDEEFGDWVWLNDRGEITKQEVFTFTPLPWG